MFQYEMWGDGEAPAYWRWESAKERQQADVYDNGRRQTSALADEHAREAGVDSLIAASNAETLLVCRRASKSRGWRCKWSGRYGENMSRDSSDDLLSSLSATSRLWLYLESRPLTRSGRLTIVVASTLRGREESDEGDNVSAAFSAFCD